MAFRIEMGLSGLRWPDTAPNWNESLGWMSKCKFFTLRRYISEFMKIFYGTEDLWEVWAIYKI